MEIKFDKSSHRFLQSPTMFSAFVLDKTVETFVAAKISQSADFGVNQTHLLPIKCLTNSYNSRDD
jgi:hypothetical protein